MRCKTCDYRLWNLATRTCPECGAPFLPSEFEFVPGAVQFCCPHCQQAYYGTDDKGRLVPSAFTCVQCAQPIEMDQMVLRPAGGVHEQQTAAFAMPWLERERRGWFKAWFGTIWSGLVRPTALMRAIVNRPDCPSGFLYALFSSLLIMAGFVGLPLLVMMLVGLIAGGSGSTLQMAGGMTIPAGVGWGFAALMLPLWCLAAHGLLRMTGGCAAPLRRTFQAICFSGGPMLFSAVPCLGIYCAMSISPIWWCVSAILMLREGQRVHGGRAALAVLALPALFIAGVIVLYSILIATMISGTNFAASTGLTATSETQQVAMALQTHALQSGGPGPAHGLELVATGALAPYDLVLTETLTDTTDVPVGSGTLDDMGAMSPAEATAAAAAAAAGQPANLIAHRVGDFVFVHHGIDFGNADPLLWTVVASPDPEVALGSAPASVTAGLAGGGTLTTPLTSGLADQNQLRAQYGLPPLPDPATVTHGKPAVKPRP